jgi:hydrogenase maturation protein HypF
VPVAQRAARVRVEGTVQGVGFRPYVYRLACELGLDGYVLNDAHGVLVELSGTEASVAAFLRRLEPEAPPLARIERVRVSAALTPDAVAAGFEIRASPHGDVADAPVTPDSAICEECLRELFAPADRRYRYPFINCTNCGPRFTIVRGIPYDRPLTTMAGFQMCERCRREYEDPGHRRFHAQPNACPECGPAVTLLDIRRPGDLRALNPAPGADLVRATAEALAQGLIVAVKGIGGYHLACRADDESAVGRLRARKHREDKPFALMVRDLDSAETLVVLEARARELLLSAERPIVLAARRPDAPVARSVAPGAPELGVMLPYSPLHHLLLADTGFPLVLTSGNISDEPIAFRDEDALARLGTIAELALVHDRPIETRTDDSVVRVASGRTAFLRRSRGYVPGALELPAPGARRPLLACGAELKNTFCVAKGVRAWVSHHVGDLSNAETLRSFTDGVTHFERLFAVSPELVVHDLHPEYLSTKYAHERGDLELLGVQHHHAHLAACLAEHAQPGPAVGLIFDGTGYGTDGTVWGGEVLVGDVAAFERVGALHPVRMPGGEQAIRQPWRMACAWLVEALDGLDGLDGLEGEEGASPAPPARLAARVDPVRWAQVAGLARSGLASPQTTSAGRLFDAVAALCGVRTEINYEGQAAIELEAACDPSERGAYPAPVRMEDGFLWIDARDTVRAVFTDAAAGVGAGRIAARFHAGLAAGAVCAGVAAAAEHGCEVAVLSGGVFANRRLLELAAAGLTAAGLRVLAPVRLPAGDGGISYGQAAVAAALTAGRP